MSNHEGIWSEYRPTYFDGWSAVKRMGDLVRCRDCKRVTVDQGDHDYREPLWCGLFHIDVSLDGFCAWGERKEVDA